MIARPSKPSKQWALWALIGCSGGENTSDGNTLSVAATAVPHAEILEAIKPQLKLQGLTLEVKVFNDYVQPNLQVAQHQIDVNYFQTKPYLDEFNASQGTKLVTLAGVHVEPLGGYSRKWKKLEELPVGASIAIPNEASNGGRALKLLQKGGLITLKNPENPLSTLRDISENPKKFVFRELESATLPRILSEVDLALINTNYALDAKLNPVRDALLIEASDSPYVNYPRNGSWTDNSVHFFGVPARHEFVASFTHRVKFETSKIFNIFIALSKLGSGQLPFLGLSSRTSR